jgi:hypothetical protein
VDTILAAPAYQGKTVFTGRLLSLDDQLVQQLAVFTGAMSHEIEILDMDVGDPHAAVAQALDHARYIFVGTWGTETGRDQNQGVFGRRQRGDGRRRLRGDYDRATKPCEHDGDDQAPPAYPRSCVTAIHWGLAQNVFMALLLLGNEAGCLISKHKEQITLCLNHSQALARSTPTARAV